MRIYDGQHGIYVNAISETQGKDVNGYLYQIYAGISVHGIRFHQGDPKDGLNGITNEALLSILIHRLQTLNEKVQCDENEAAMILLERTLEVLNKRYTKNKISD